MSAPCSFGAECPGQQFAACSWCGGCTMCCECEGCTACGLPGDDCQCDIDAELAHD